MKIVLTEFVTLDGVSQGPGSPDKDAPDLAGGQAAGHAAAPPRPADLDEGCGDTPWTTARFLKIGAGGGMAPGAPASDG